MSGKNSRLSKYTEEDFILLTAIQLVKSGIPIEDVAAETRFTVEQIVEAQEKINGSIHTRKTETRPKDTTERRAKWITDLER